MKKIAMLVAAVATLCFGNAQAQNVNLPEAGTLSTEVQFNPFDQDGEQFKLDALKLRYFLTDVDAVRLKVGLNINNNNTLDLVEDPGADATQYKKDAYNYTKDNAENRVKKGSFSIDLGYERHLLKDGRLDIYAGAEVGIELGWTKQKGVDCYYSYDPANFDEDKPSTYSFFTKETEISGAVYDATNNTMSDFGYTQIRAGVFTGLDFYLYKGLYVGTELGLKFKTTSYSDPEMTLTDNDPNAAAKDHVITTKWANNDSDTSLKFYIEPTIRLGWAF
ncbi:MAG: hypothetical protein ACI4TW_07320 [Prevotella sp.]